MRDVPHRLRWFSTIVSLRRTDRVLEVGCGSGHLLALLAARQPDGVFVGIDRSALQVRKATQALRALPTPPTVLHLALEDAPPQFAGVRFTRILAMNVNLAWTDPIVAGHAVRNLLAPRGVAIIGFEPPTPSGRATLQEKLQRAADTAGFTQRNGHLDPESSAFAVEWTAGPQRATTGTP
jgi:SAM-dependent methyltransferase